MEHCSKLRGAGMQRLPGSQLAYSEGFVYQTVSLTMLHVAHT